MTLCPLSSVSSLRKDLKRNSKEKPKPPVLAQHVTLSELLLRRTGLTMTRKTTKGNTKMSTGLAGITDATNSASEQAPFPLGTNVVSLGSRRQLRRRFGTHNEGAEVLAFEKPLAFQELSERNDGLDTPSAKEQIRSETNFAEIVGNSSALRRALELAEKVACWDSTVLVLWRDRDGQRVGGASDSP